MLKKRKLSAVRSWKMLLLSLPKGIAAFLTVVAGLSVSLPLSVILVGLPLLAETLVLSGRMMESERRTASQWLSGGAVESGSASLHAEAQRQWKGWRSLLAVLGRGKSYRSILYGLLQLPAGIAAFTLAAVLPITAWAVMLSPLAYQISVRVFSFKLFGNDVLTARLLPSWSTYQISWLYGGIGALFVLLTPAVLRALGRLYAAWILAINGPEELPAAQITEAAPPLPANRFSEPQIN